MRGIDYNTQHPAGIALLIAKPLSSERAYRQALGRVGRYATNCIRCRLEGVKVDKAIYDSKLTFMDNLILKQ